MSEPKPWRCRHCHKEFPQPVLCLCSVPGMKEALGTFELQIPVSGNGEQRVRHVRVIGPRPLTDADIAEVHKQIDEWKWSMARRGDEPLYGGTMAQHDIAEGLDPETRQPASPERLEELRKIHGERQTIRRDQAALDAADKPVEV